MNRVERFALYVALTALTALAIDGVLPAMPMIEADLEDASPFTGAQIITVFVFGMAGGELLTGPLSDAVGRRSVVIAGLVVFAIGTIIAATADSFAAVRFLQGVGVAGPKIGTRAMIRDRYAGNDMAQVMSVIFTLLILVPMIAPAIGAVIAAASGWRGVFWAYLVLALVLGVWLAVRHPETLHPEKKIPLHVRRLVRNTCTVLGRADVTPVIIATGFIFGAQLTWLYAILRSTMNDHFRKATRRSRLAVAVARDPHQLVADAPVQMARLCTCPSRLLTELRTVDAKLIRRIDFGEEDRKIVAADMGLNRNALGVRLHRARAALREAIQYHCGACCLEDPDDCYCPV